MKHRSDAKPNIVGPFIRQRREAQGISQRTLGTKFNPPVTTQFISNLERGVTPLPAHHVGTICQTLQLPERELMALMEREYQLKLCRRLGHDGVLDTGDTQSDWEYILCVFDHFRTADAVTKEAFILSCRQLFKLERA